MVDEHWDRRQFLKRLGILGVGGAGISAVTISAHDKGRDEPRPKSQLAPMPNYRKGLEPLPTLVAVGKGAPEKAVRASIEALGGMTAFVKRGEKVVIKPNIAWDRTPAQAANTHPEVVAALVTLCKDAGAARVTVVDNTCNEAKRCYTRSGIWKAAEAAGAEVVLPEEHRFEVRRLGGVLGKVPVLRPLLEADRLINAAVAKHHGLAKFTGAMKNLYGVIGGRRNRHHQQIDESIVALTEAFLPTLSIVDATRVLLRNGPQGGDLGDTLAVGAVAASTDPVALDAYACTLIGVSPDELPYLAMASRRKLGVSDPTAFEKREVS